MLCFRTRLPVPKQLSPFEIMRQKIRRRHRFNTAVLHCATVWTKVIVLIWYLAIGNHPVEAFNII